ncbi:cupin domain-containing protein [Dermatophilaceae bacterium Soc4.6]
MTGPLPLWAQSLQLRPHPEGGWYAETWRHGTLLAPGHLVDPVMGGYPGPRSLGTAIYFLLMPGEESAWHRVRSDELWFAHRGALELGLGGVGDAPVPESALRLGVDVSGGDHPQALVPAATWQRALPLGEQPCLVSCVVTPGFDFDDFRLA